MKTFKKIFFPSGEQTEAIAYESWTVRWYSRYGQFSSETRQECEVFTNKADADAFAEQLRLAFKLVRHTSGNQVVVEENKQL